MLHSILPIILGIIFDNLKSYEHLLEEIVYVSIEFNEVEKEKKKELIAEEKIPDKCLYQ